MHKKFEIIQTKIKGGCQSGRKVVTHNSKSDLPLAAQLDSVGQTEMMATKSISESSGSSKKGCGSFPSVCPGFCYLFGLLTRNNDGAAATVVILRPVDWHFLSWRGTRIL